MTHAEKEIQNMNTNTKFYNLPLYLNNLFNRKIELLASVNELFELELAYMEYNCLPEDDLLDRLAYFKSVDGKFTNHFLMYNHSTKHLQIIALQPQGHILEMDSFLRVMPHMDCFLIVESFILN